MTFKYRLTLEDGYVEFDSSEAAEIYAAALEIVEPEIEEIEVIIPGPSEDEQIIMDVIAGQTFGLALIAAIRAENIGLGLTDVATSITIRSRMTPIGAALAAGALEDAIYLAKNFNPANKDATYITDARLLSIVNRIETYLELPLSESLN